jgi:hypothetical protein
MVRLFKTEKTAFGEKREVEFYVEQEWFEEYLKEKYEETKNELYESIDSFQCDYTSNDAKEVYEQAREDGYLIL